MTAAIHTEERFEDEVCETLRAKSWLYDGPPLDEVYRRVRGKADSHPVSA